MLVSHRHFPLLHLLWTHNIKHTNEKLHRRQNSFEIVMYLFQLQEGKTHNKNISQDLTLELKNELHK